MKVLAVATVAAAVAGLVSAVSVPGQPLQWLKAKRVVLVSIDGCHASDLAWYTSTYPTSTLATLQNRSFLYKNAYAANPSDSFPGLLALVTGGSPYSTGVWYDDSYDASLYPPGSNCTGDVGTEVVFDESIDLNSTDISGGGGIDRAALPMKLANGKCSPVYPHEYVRVNTVFEVAKSKGLVTAWTDKHRAYDLVNGPSGTGVDDLYTPEIASVSTDYNATSKYDQLHVDAIVNWIKGVGSDGKTKLAAVPSIMGGNFQTVSVTQKQLGGGYADATTPTPILVQAFVTVDGFFKQIVDALVAEGLYDSTLIVVSAKHGQSPKDPKKLSIITPGNLTAALGVEAAQITADSGALIWLKNASDASIAASNLYKSAGKVNAVQVYTKAGLVAAGVIKDASDPRAPDIYLQPTSGTVYTKIPNKKIAEHGSSNDDDRHVALMVSHSWIRSTVEVDNRVDTAQVAPTILGALGIDAGALQAVQQEGTLALPGITFL